MLTSGTRQKLNLTLALMHRPSVLLLDEPYQGFDWETYQRFWDLTGKLREQGCAVLIISHLFFEQKRFDALYTAIVMLFWQPAALPVVWFGFFGAALTYGALGLLLGVLVKNELAGFFVIIMLSLTDTFIQNPLGNPAANQDIVKAFPSYGPTQVYVAGGFTNLLAGTYLLLSLAWFAGFALLGLAIFWWKTRSIRADSPLFPGYA